MSGWASSLLPGLSSSSPRKPRDPTRSKYVNEMQHVLHIITFACLPLYGAAWGRGWACVCVFSFLRG